MAGARSTRTPRLEPTTTSCNSTGTGRPIHRIRQPDAAGQRPCDHRLVAHGREPHRPAGGRSHATQRHHAAVILVVDQAPPQFELTVSPSMLWPPDNKMVQVAPSWTVSDDCDASPSVSLVSITVDDDGKNVLGEVLASEDVAWTGPAASSCGPPAAARVRRVPTR